MATASIKGSAAQKPGSEKNEQHFTTIKLEIIQKTGVSLMLFVIVATFVVCLVLATMDTKIRLHERKLKSVPCTETLTNNCFYNNTGVIVYTLEIDNLSELSKYIYAIGRVKSISDTVIDKEIEYQVQVFGRNSPSDSWVEKMTEDYTRNLSCEKIGDYCLDHIIFLFTPIRDQEIRFNITLKEELFENYGETEYYVYWQKESFTGVVFTFLVIFFVCACSFLIAYIRSVKIDHDHPHPEQRWIAFLVGACIFMNRINEIPSIITGEHPLITLSLISNTLSNVVFLVVFMIIIEELRRPSLKYTFKFFFYKFLYGAITFSVVLSVQLIKRNRLPVGLNFTDFLSKDQTIPRDENAFKAYAGLTIVLGFIYVAWSLWFIKRIRELRRFLKGTPFILTRFRQLSFRLFLILGFFFSIYFITLMLVSYNEFEYGIEEDRPLSSLILYSVYILTLGYVYLPADSKDIITLGLKFGFPIYGGKAEVKLIGPDPSDDKFKENRFYVQTAKNLSWISLKVYFEPGTEDAEFSRKESVIVEERVNCRQLAYEYKEKIYDEETDTHAYIFVSKNRIVVAFRGTNSVVNAKTDANIFRCDWIPLPGRYRVRRNQSDYGLPQGLMETVNPIAVHKGFFTSYCKIRNNMVNRVRTISGEILKAKTRDSPPLNILVTGHSLGGALATFAALDIAEMGMPNTKVIMYNFGSPRVGNHSFADYYNLAVPNSYRITGDQDIVTALPKFMIYFKHIGNEVTVDPDGNVLLKMTSFERFLHTKNSLDNHRIYCYFNAMSLCLENICCRYVVEKALAIDTELSAQDLISYIQLNLLDEEKEKDHPTMDTKPLIHRLSETTDEDQLEREEEIQPYKKQPAQQSGLSPNRAEFPVFGKPHTFFEAASASSPNLSYGAFFPAKSPVLVRNQSVSVISPTSDMQRSRYRTQILSQVLNEQDPLVAHNYEDERGLLKALGMSPQDKSDSDPESSQGDNDFFSAITNIFK